MFKSSSKGHFWADFSGEFKCSKRNSKITSDVKLRLEKTPNKKKIKTFKPGLFLTFWKGYSEAEWSKIGDFGMSFNVPKITENQAEP